jgi:hypothetical protein
MHYTETELAKLIESVEKEFGGALAKAEEEKASLAKAEDHEFQEAKEKKPEHEESESKDEDHEAEKESKEAAPEHEEGDEEALAAHHEDGEESHGYDEEDLDHMHKMYMSMSKGELKAHHDAVRKCLDTQMAKGDVEPYAPHGAEGEESPASHSHPDVQKNEDGIEASEPHGTVGPESEASDAHGDKINVGLKKNEKERRGNGGQMSAQKPPKQSPGAKSPASKVEGVQMGKSEDTQNDLLKSEVEAQKAKVDTLQKTLDGVTEFLTKLVAKTNVPQGKAVTSYDAIAKSEELSSAEPMTKSEIVGVLSKKAMDPNLSKSDRDAINNFYLNGANVTSISHLLK